MADEFKQIREAVTAEQTARLYGLEVRRNHRAKCPFHHGQHENLSFYDGGFKCFVCGAHGSSLDFVAQYLGITIPEAARRIDRDFHLGIMDARPQAPKSWVREQQARAEQEGPDALAEAFEKWADCMYHRLLLSLPDDSATLRDGPSFSGSVSELWKAKRSIHKRMIHNGRTFALLWDYVHQDWPVELGGGGVTPRDMNRLFRLFAADRQAAKEYTAEWATSKSPFLKADAERYRKEFCIYD